MVYRLVVGSAVCGCGFVLRNYGRTLVLVRLLFRTWLRPVTKAKKGFATTERHCSSGWPDPGAPLSGSPSRYVVNDMQGLAATDAWALWPHFILCFFGLVVKGDVGPCKLAAQLFIFSFDLVAAVAWPITSVPSGSPLQ